MIKNKKSKKVKSKKVKSKKIPKKIKVLCKMYNIRLRTKKGKSYKQKTICTLLKELKKKMKKGNRFGLKENEEEEVIEKKPGYIKGKIVKGKKWVKENPKKALALAIGAPLIIAAGVAAGPALASLGPFAAAGTSMISQGAVAAEQATLLIQAGNPKAALPFLKKAVPLLKKGAETTGKAIEKTVNVIDKVKSASENAHEIINKAQQIKSSVTGPTDDIDIDIAPEQTMESKFGKRKLYRGKGKMSKSMAMKIIRDIYRKNCK
jgi:hypothetical protein